jgi:hypothetical protein
MTTGRERRDVCFDAFKICRHSNLLTRRHCVSQQTSSQPFCLQRRFLPTCCEVHSVPLYPPGTNFWLAHPYLFHRHAQGAHLDVVCAILARNRPVPHGARQHGQHEQAHAAHETLYTSETRLRLAREDAEPQVIVGQFAARSA